MPSGMALSMRHTKLKPEEAALLAGEIHKPSWQSKNEGIHERVSFEDSIWGFDLAGGSFYKTSLRVTSVKPDSRAEKAGIRPGDKLKRINDIDTSTLTIQEAHEIIIESGIHLRLAVTAPEDEEDSYFCYEDPLLTNGYDSDEERRKEEQRERRRHVHAKVSSFWSLQWPWVSKRRVIYRESNCFLVPSKFEDKNREKFPVLPVLRLEEDIKLYNKKCLEELEKEKNEKKAELENSNDKVTELSDSKKSEESSQVLTNGNTQTNLEKNQENAQDKKGDILSNVNAPTKDSNIEEENITENHRTESDEKITQALTNDYSKKSMDENPETNEEENLESKNQDENKNETTADYEDTNEKAVDNEDTNETTADNEDEIIEDDEIIDEIMDTDENISQNDQDNILNSILTNDENVNNENSSASDNER